MLAALILCAMASSAFGWYEWYWTQPCIVQDYSATLPNTTDSQSVDFRLSKKGGCICTF